MLGDAVQAIAESQEEDIEEEKDDTRAIFGAWWPVEDIVRITLDEESFEVVDSTHGMPQPSGLRSYKELEEADQLDLSDLQSDEDEEIEHADGADAGKLLASNFLHQRDG